MKPQLKETMPPLHQQYAAQIARQVATPSNDAYVTASKQVSVPLQLALLARVEVLAQRSGCSRGAMVAQLTNVGVSMVLDQLDADALAEIGQQISEREQEVYDEFEPYTEG